MSIIDVVEAEQRRHALDSARHDYSYAQPACTQQIVDAKMILERARLYNAFLLGKENLTLDDINREIKAYRKEANGN